MHGISSRNFLTLEKHQSREAVGKCSWRPFLTLLENPMANLPWRRRMRWLDSVLTQFTLGSSWLLWELEAIDLANFQGALSKSEKGHACIQVNRRSNPAAQRRSKMSPSVSY